MKTIVRSLLLTFCLYASQSYAMLPSNKLLQKIADPKYQPNTKDETKLVNIFAPYAHNERALDDLPKMVLAASAFITFFNPDAQDKATALNDINRMLEQYENYYHARNCSEEKVNTEDKQNIVSHLNYSPYVYNKEMVCGTSDASDMKKKFDELIARRTRVQETEKTTQSILASVKQQLSTSPDHVQKTIAPHVDLTALSIGLQLAQRILDRNKEQCITTMKNVKTITQDIVKELSTRDEKGQLAKHQKNLAQLQQEIKEAESEGKGIITKIFGM